MTGFESFRIAINSLLLNRLRALLTMLGIIIGVAAVISLMSLGRGLESDVAEQFENLGVDTMTITSGSPTRGFRTATTPLTTADVEALSDPTIAPSLSNIAAEYDVRATIVYGYNGTSMTVQGVTTNYADVNDWHPQGGAGFFTQADIDAQAQIAFLGTSAVEDLFGEDYFETQIDSRFAAIAEARGIDLSSIVGSSSTETIDPVGLTILINDRVFTIVGVMEEQDAVGFSDPNSAILVPISTAQARLDNARIAGAGYEVSSIQAQVSDTDLVDTATDEITAYLLAEHGITNSNEADFNISNPADLIESRTETMATLTLFLSAIAGISLVVGGIGVMNIMLVSVSERTREIGLRKAVGAQASAILSQFLIESVVLSLIGGAVGILLGSVIAQVVGQLMLDMTLTPNLDVILLAVGISSAIGIFFGLYPANRAARMRPIEALRFE